MVCSPYPLSRNQMSNKSGVYSITHTRTGKVYIGSAVNFANRFQVHRSRLKRGNHHSKKLQSAWDKYGPGEFIFAEILVCSKTDVLVYEQIVIDYMRPFFNSARIAGNTLGVRLDSTQKKELKAAQQAHRAANPELYRSRAAQYEYKGKSYTASEGALAFGINSQTFRKRLRSGLTFAQAVEAPMSVGGGRDGLCKYPYKGENVRAVDIARMAGERSTCVLKWLVKGYSAEFIISGKARERKARK